jgi:oligogalacturonide lyase
MPRVIRPTIVFVLLAFRAFAADTPSTTPLPSDWIDPQTGHRIIRLSPDEGGSSLYFHQHSYTPEGDKIIIHTRSGLATVDLKALGTGKPKFELIAPNTRAFATSWRTREAYVHRGDSIVAVHLDTKAERTVVKLPPTPRPAGRDQLR